jgi:hypothetical protein
MTLPSLLRHLGIHAPRGVAVDGRILTLRQATTTGTAITPLAPHTFHDGPDPEPEGPPDSDPWWRADPASRMADTAAMATGFPGFSLTDPNGAGYDWTGILDTGRGWFRVLVLARRDHSIPVVRVLSPRRLGRDERGRFRRAEHLYDSGALCLADTVDWDPARHTTAVAVAWTAHWLAAYTEWRLSGMWPVEGYRPHAA